MSAVLAFKISVKRIIETESETIITTGFFQLLLPREPPSIIGSSVNAHGASTVRTPARNDIGTYSIKTNSKFYNNSNNTH